MQDRTVGLVIRRLRQRRDLRQKDVGARAGLSQQVVSLVELGRFGEVDIETARRVAAAVEASLELVPRWRGPELDRLLDADHAVLVERLVGELREAGWEVLVEWSFNHFGERGSVDVVAWKAAERALFIGEVKSAMIDTQATNGGLDRKARVAPKLLAEERGWRAASIGRVLVMPGEPASYDAIRRHASTFDAALPARTREVRRWLASPDGDLRGILFLGPTTVAGTPTERAPKRRRRVRRPCSETRISDR
jgi:transcriptional regulator with XRE-family HTH domain